MNNHSTPLVRGPASIGIIMDGNRRWAKAEGLPVFAGHQAGLAKAKEIARVAFDAGVQTLYFYAFSVENWKRAPKEVLYLMTLFEKAITNEFEELAKEGTRIRFIGELTRLPEKLQRLAKEIEQKTVGNMRGTLVIALSYGGRAEIVHAANVLLQRGCKVVTEADVQNALWTKELPDPDLIIRTSGEQRLSGFLPWQSVYSELIFTNTLWPAYTKEEFEQHLALFAERQRRFGV